MSKCPKCDSSLYVRKCMKCLHSKTPKVKKNVTPCEWPCMATIHVQETLTGRPVMGVRTQLDGAPANTDANGFRVVEGLVPGDHSAQISLAELLDKYARPIGVEALGVTKAIAASQNQFYAFTLDPLTALKVVVRRRHDSQGLANAKVTLTPGKAGNTVAAPQLPTAASGEATFARLRQDTYQIAVELDDPGKTKYELETAEDHHTLDMGKNPDEHVVWARLVVHLRLKYLCPDTKSRHFPKDFPVTVAFDDATTQDVTVLDDKGYIKFEIADDKKKAFTLKFDSGKARYLVHPTREVPDASVVTPGVRTDLPKTKVFEDPTEAQLLEWTTDNKKFFALPKVWALVHSDWDEVDVTVKPDGQVDINDGVGVAAKPAELTLKPKFQYVRFEFHDRKYGAVGEPHDGKRVSIPAIMLKASRESDDAGAPVSPVSGTHDAVSNWLINPADADKACQVLPWIKLKDDAGAELPKFNNKMLLEFGWKDAFVQSTGKGAGDRKIIVLPATDARRKPDKDRQQFYDLPEVWKSKWYFTRFSDPTKNKFFDKLLGANDPDLAASLAEAGKLTFSLDDMVLVDSAGNQETIQDKKSDLSAAPFSKYSRITILELDRTDKKFKVKVYDPQVDAVYWSKQAFASEAVAGPWRNVIATYPPNPRVVVFCSAFHDVFDKRTKPADCAGKKIMGARAAKHEDTDVSSKLVLLDQAAHATNGYVGYKGTVAPRWHYLHYGDVDGATVYGALVVYWSASFKKSAALEGGTDVDVTLFRNQGMALAMTRWNDKDYYFEEHNDKTELRIKTFTLLEAKGVEITAGIFSNTGGKAICQVQVRDDALNGGSWAMPDGSAMMMRRSGATDEGKNWGDGPGNLPVIAKFEGGSANAKCAFAHELGHAAFALYDSYLTTYGKLCVTGNKNTKLSWTLCCYENMYTGKQEGQEYFGMPYELDDGELMNVNRAETRLRYAWQRANWLNDQAKPGGQDKLPELLGGRRFRAAYEAPGKAKLKYHREDTDRNIFKPSTSATAYALSNQGKCDLHLYRLGDDEFARILKGGPYNGILVVSLKVCVKFETMMPWAKKGAYFVGDMVKHAGKFYICKTDHSNKDLDAVADWTLVAANVLGQALVAGQFVEQAGDCYKHNGVNPGAAGLVKYPAALSRGQQIVLMETLNARINAMLANGVSPVGKFKLYGGGDFSTSMVRIFPQWSFGTDPGGSHMTLTYSMESKAFQPSGAAIRAGVQCDTSTLIRYLLGKLGDDPTQWAASGLTGDLARADLGKLSDWMNGNSGGQGFIVADNA